MRGRTSRGRITTVDVAIRLGYIQGVTEDRVHWVLAFSYTPDEREHGRFAERIAEHLGPVQLLEPMHLWRLHEHVAQAQRVILPLRGPGAGATVTCRISGWDVDLLRPYVGKGRKGPAVVLIDLASGHCWDAAMLIGDGDVGFTLVGTSDEPLAAALPPPDDEVREAVVFDEDEQVYWSADSGMED